MERQSSIWPYFWVAVGLWIALTLVRPAGVNPVSFGAALAAITAVALLVIGIARAIRR